jgi:hypothetical protein
MAMRANITERICTALLWLLDHLKPREQPSEQELIEYSKELAQRRIPRLLPPPQPPSTYEPPQRTTDPTQQVHLLAETGRIASMIRTQKLPTVKGLHKAHFYRMPSTEDAAADRFLLDVSEPEEDEDATSKSQAIVRLRHEGRGKAS